MTSDKPADEILTTKDVCEILKIGRTKLYEMISNKEISSFKVGRNIRMSARSFPKASNVSFDSMYSYVVNDDCGERMNRYKKHRPSSCGWEKMKSF